MARSQGWLSLMHSATWCCGETLASQVWLTQGLDNETTARTVRKPCGALHTHRPALSPLKHPQSLSQSPRQVHRAGRPLSGAPRAQRRNSAVPEVPDKVVNLPLISSLVKGQARLESKNIDVRKIVTDSLILGLTGGTVFQCTHNQGLLPVRPQNPLLPVCSGRC